MELRSVIQKNNIELNLSKFMGKILLPYFKITALGATFKECKYSNLGANKNKCKSPCLVSQRRKRLGVGNYITAVFNYAKVYCGKSNCLSHNYSQ
jgi:hypothetical protein